MTIKKLLLLCCLIQGIWAFEGRPVLNELGQETGLVNINPDVNGDPWIVGGMKPKTEEDRIRAASYSELELTSKTRNRALPKEVILMDNDEFPPVFNQKGGSCAQASGVAYLYSYQMNVLDGLKGSTSNIKAYGFTHNYLNQGDNSNGSWYWDGWGILQKVGAPTATTFHGVDNGGLSGTRWMNGADRWHTANNNRVVEIKSISVTSMDGIEKIKNWMYDLNGTDPNKKGGCVVFAANGGSAGSNSTVSSGPHAGEPLCTKLTKDNMNHAMTFAGYSDEVEGGAVLLLNSWGTGWENGGTVWVPYTTLINGGLYDEEVWCVTTSQFTPKLELKAKVKHNSRSSVKITTGMANSLSATSPTVTKTYGKAFNKSAGAHPMEGKGGSQEIEVSLDVSELYDEITVGDAKFFFMVEASGSSGTISDLSLLDYTQGGAPIEFFSEDGTVTINGSAQSTVIMSSSPNIVVSYPNGGEKLEQFSTQTITWGDNIDGNVKIELVKGSEKTVLAASTESDGSFEWSVPEDQELGDDYKICITSLDDNTLSDESDDAFSVTSEFIISEYPYSEDFDALDTASQEMPEGWSQAKGDDIDWLLWSGPTPSRVGSSPDSTGPNADFGGNGNYIYVEASDPNNPGKKAEFLSPKFDLRSLHEPVLQCKVHMFSARKEMGELTLDISVDGEWKSAVQKIDSDQGDQWINFEQPLDDYIGQRVVFRLSGTTGDSWCSDICVDEILIDGSISIEKSAADLASSVVLRNSILTIPFRKSGAYSVTLFSLTGKELFKSSGVTTEASTSISLKELDLAHGVYYCKVYIDGYTKVVPVVLNK